MPVDRPMTPEPQSLLFFWLALFAMLGLALYATALRALIDWWFA